MSSRCGRLRIIGLMVAGVMCLPILAQADTQSAQSPQSTHRTRAKKKELPPPPLPSGTQGPVPQVPLDSLPAVAPQVTYDDGLLTIVAPNSTLGDILRSVKKHTSADIDVPATASERVVTRLGPAPAREVMAELLNGSKFNYILLGSPQDVNVLTRVVLVAKTGPDNPPSAGPAQAENSANPVSEPPPTAQPMAEGQEPEAPDDTPDDSNNAEQNSAETDQPADQPGVKTPQQLLQEMQQRQLLMQQQQQGGQPGVQPGYPPAPGMPIPHQPQPPQNPNQDQ
jgi:hypothetical protein